MAHTASSDVIAATPDVVRSPRRDPLTDRAIRALSPQETPIDVRDGGQPGLVLTVLPSGRKQFSVRYRFQGRQRRLLLGEYPAVTLAVARKRARKAQSAIDDGHDVAGERQAAKAARTDTVATLADDYLRKHALKFKRSGAEDKRILDVEVLPRWRDRSVRELTRRDVRALIERIAERAPIMANRVLAVVRKMLNFAVDHDWIDANPAARVAKPAPERSRDRVLTEDEIRQLWRVLSHLPTTAERPAPGRKRAKGEKDDPLCPISAPLAALLKVRLLTAQRGGEVARMRWADVDLGGGWWTIPAAHTKNGQPHRVPLTSDTVELIRSEKPKNYDDETEYVFAGTGGASVLHRAKKAPAAIARVLKIDFRGHDLRRTAATFMAASGISREHIGHVLNHVEGGARATRVYDRYAYDREKQIALETWARTLKAILDLSQKTGTIVAFSHTHART
jgi:integrase